MKTHYAGNPVEKIKFPAGSAGKSQKPAGKLTKPGGLSFGPKKKKFQNIVMFTVVFTIFGPSGLIYDVKMFKFFT